MWRTSSQPPDDKLKWKALCGHIMPTEMQTMGHLYLAMYMYGVVTSLYVYESNVL